MIRTWVFLTITVLAGCDIVATVNTEDCRAMCAPHGVIELDKGTCRCDYARDLSRVFYPVWSPSYCAVSCGGASLEIVKRYVEAQRGDSASFPP